MAWVHRGLAGVGAGTVTFKDGATVLAANVPLNHLGLAFYTTSSLAVGSHPISVVYSGTDTYGTSTDSLTEVVGKASTNIRLVSNHNPSSRNQNVTFRATVTHRGKPVTSGTVTFRKGATVLAGPVALNAQGKASVSTSSLSPGIQPSRVPWLVAHA